MAAYRWLVLSGELLLALLLIYILALLSWDFIAPKLPVVESRSMTVVSGGKPQATTDWSAFSALNPFYRDQKTEVVEDTALAEARETNLDLELFGIRYSPDGNGVAIIRTPDKQQGAFRQGDEIFHGVILNRILEDRVAIERAGVLEVLTFPGQKGTGQFGPTEAGQDKAE